MRRPELFPMHPQMEAPIIAVPHRRTAPKKTYGESTPCTEDGAGSVLADAIGGKLGGGRGELNSGRAGRKGRGGGSAEDHNSGGVSHHSFKDGTRSVSAILLESECQWAVRRQDRLVFFESSESRAMAERAMVGSGPLRPMLAANENELRNAFWSRRNIGDLTPPGFDFLPISYRGSLYAKNSSTGRASKRYAKY